MTVWEYTYVWWEGSATDTARSHIRDTSPPIGDEVLDRLNGLGADSWEVGSITAAPLTTGWISPRGGSAAAGFTDEVHYLALLHRPLNHSEPRDGRSMTPVPREPSRHDGDRASSVG